MSKIQKNPYAHKIALIIPTRNRPDLLKKLLDSIKLQTVQPDQIIIVDGSDTPVKNHIASYLPGQCTYVYVFPPSLTTQRNKGIQLLFPEITIAGYLDDDVELKPDAMEEMFLFWENSPEDVGGAGFNIVNNPPRKKVTKAITQFFAITGNPPGRVLKSGFCTAEVPLTKNRSSEWLCGGATLWRRKILEDYKYDEWYKGWAYHEDAEFSYRVSKKYRLMVVYKAKVDHNPLPYDPSKNRILGKMAVINRFYFVKKNAELSIPWFYWATLGESLLNILSCIPEKNWQGLNRGLGNIDALIDITFRNIRQIDTNFRKTD